MVYADKINSLVPQEKHIAEEETCISWQFMLKQ